MEHILIVTNDGKDKDQSVTRHIKEIIEGYGKVCTLCQKDADKKIIEDSIPADIDCVIVIGGDGSFIEVARILHDRSIPMLGVNMGTLGYLTEVELKDIDESINKLLREEYTLEHRMMLEADFNDTLNDVALNDIVISRKGGIRIIHFRIWVNGELLNCYEADGIIISTPTGSTAYNLSAGGPIVEPTASLLLVTPICSHALNTSSVVLSGEDEVEIEIGEGRNGTKEEVLVSFDGEQMLTMNTGERIAIRRSGTTTELIRLNKVSFLEILRRKMKGN
ncbi:MAG: NAD(+)/NADH kinase [Lachnospiraceae bacterium]|nr:NAD(+)/NADH kinase [Lachnospiraceae bacterium]